MPRDLTAEEIQTILDAGEYDSTGTHAGYTDAQRDAMRTALTAAGHEPADFQPEKALNIYISNVHMETLAAETTMQLIFGGGDIVDQYADTDVLKNFSGGWAPTEFRRKTGLTPSEYAAAQLSGAPIREAYITNAENLQECLDSIPALRESLRTQWADLLQLSVETFGTTFGDTIGSAFPRSTGTRYANTDTPASINDQSDNKAVVDAMTAAALEAHQEGLPAGPVPGDVVNVLAWARQEDQTKLSKVDYNALAPPARAAAPKPYMIDIADSDAKKLPYPNYPGMSSLIHYDINTTYSSTQEVTTRVVEDTAIFPNIAPTTQNPTNYPIGWATAIASGLSNIQRTMANLTTAPTYEAYEEAGDNSAYENTVYAIAPLMVRVGGRDTDTQGAGFDAANGRWKTVNYELGIDEAPAGGFYGLLLGADDIGTENLAAVVTMFEGFDSEFSQKVGVFVAKYNALASSLSNAIECQIVAFAKDAETDKDVADILDARGDKGHGHAASKAATAGARKRALDNLTKALRDLNVAETASDIEDSVDQRNILFKEQCFLLNYINIFMQQKKIEDLDQGKKRLPYVAPDNSSAKASNASLLVSGDAYGFLNKITLNPKLKHLVNIENAELSLLQPSIRLYKVVYDEWGNDDYQVEMKFDSHFTANDLANFGADLGARGVGAGLKSFVFSYEGSNPFAVKKSIKANLKIFASNFRELVRERGSSVVRLNNEETHPTRRTYKYIDLALKTGRAPHVDSNNPDPADACGNNISLREQNENLADLNFRLRAEVGWAVPNKNSPLLSAELRKAIQSSYVTLNLTPTVHNFDFDETGQVVMNINYLAYVEEFFDNKSFNIFANAPSSKGDAAAKGVTSPLASVERIKRTMALAEIAKECQDSSTVSQVKEDFKTRIAADQLKALEFLTDSLLQQGDIRFITMPYEDLKSYLLNNSTTATKTVKDLVGSSTAATTGDNDIVANSIDAGLAEAKNQSIPSDDETDEEEEEDEGPEADAIAAALLASPQAGETVAYFYLDRLIDTILANIDAELETLSSDSGPLARITKYVLPAAENSPSKAPVPISRTTRQQKLKEFKIAKDNFKKLRIILGPVEFANSPSNQSTVSTFATFGDIPISVKYFVEYMTDKMLKKEETFYSLTKFLNDIMNEFVRDFLNSRECFRNMKTKVRAQQASLTSWSPSTQYDALEMKIASVNATGSAGYNNLESLGGQALEEALQASSRRRALIRELSALSPNDPILYLSGPPDSARTSISPSQEFNYFVYFAGQIQPIEKMKGVRTDDENRGIFHYMLGRDKGLIKNISLSKTQTRGLAEVRFEQDGYDGLRQLRVVYDVDIDSYANINTYPGTYIYVDPAGFDPGYNIDKIAMTELGIGGYYMIIRSEHEFGAGKANTKITAKWVNQVEAEGAAAACQPLRDENTGNNDPSPRCKKYVDEREAAAKGDDDAPWYRRG